jgi:hypothetical protein
MSDYSEFIGFMAEPSSAEIAGVVVFGCTAEKIAAFGSSYADRVHPLVWSRSQIL